MKENQVADGDAVQADGVGQNEQLDSFEKNSSGDRVAYETYDKVVKQRVKLNERVGELESKLDNYKQKSLESEGKKDEAVEYWKGRAVEFENKYKQANANFGWNQIESQLTNELNRAGCVAPEVAIGLIDRTELKMVDVDDNYRVNKSDLERLVESVKRDERSQKIKLFGSVQGVNDMTPSSGVDFKKDEPKQDLSKLSADELIAKLKES